MSALLEMLSVSAPISTAKILVLIDPGVSEPQFLAQEVIPEATALILDPEQDGVKQITEILKNHPEVESLHLVSHGSPGCLYLGNSQLSLDSLEQYNSQLRQWCVSADRQDNSPTLVLYGCNVAAGDAGAEFIAKLHQITGVEIAASSTRIGNRKLEGNWDLDVTTHNQPVKIAFSEAATLSYQGILVQLDVNEIFKLNGTATATSIDTVRLTQNSGDQAGTAMSKVRIDFNQAWTFDFSFYLGDKDDYGADGIGIVFHNDPSGQNAIGAPGGGLGFLDITNGIGIELDTYNNGSYGDIYNDHTNIQRSIDFTALTDAQDLGNIEDDKLHRAIIQWNPATQSLSYSIDGVNKTPLNSDLITNEFGGSSLIHFGISGSTGGSINEHRFIINNFQGRLVDAEGNDYVGITNTAPSFTSNATLASINQDADANAIFGDTVANLFSDKFDDPNPGAILEGIAVVGNSANAATQGKWEYSTDGYGHSWYDLSTSVNDVGGAIALSATTKVRFQPVASYSGTPPALTVRALDNTYSENFTSDATIVNVNTSNNGGQTAIAADTNTIGTSIIALPDNPPVLNTSGTGNYYKNATPQVISPDLTVNDPDPGATLNGAKVSISGNFNASQDRLGIQGQSGTSGTVNGINWSYNTSSGILNFSGSASVATYQTVLRQVTYNSTNATPTSANRSIEFNLGTTLANPENDHFYEFVSETGISWTSAKDAAAAKTHFGLQGYLATITSPIEQTFINGKVDGNGWLGAVDAAAENGTPNSAQEGVWRWVTGPEAGTQFWSGNGSGSAFGGGYFNWAGGEPNNARGEHYAHVMSSIFGAQKGKWNDLPGNVDAITNPDFKPQGYIVEYGGMPNDPTLQLSSSVNLSFYNHAPTVTSTVNGGNTDEDATDPFTLNLLSTANDVDSGDELSVVEGATASSSNIERTVEFEISEAGVLSLDPDQFNDLAAGENETITVTYDITDDTEIISNTATFVVHGVNDAPVAIDISGGTITEDDNNPLTLDLLDGATDADTNDVLSIAEGYAVTSDNGRTVVANINNGLLSLDPDQFNDLATGESEEITVNYGITDLTATTVNTATFVVTGVNDAPVVTPISGEPITEDDTNPLTLDLLDGATDADTNDVLSIAEEYTVTSDNGDRTVEFEISPEGELSLDPDQFSNLAAGETEKVTINYGITDGTATTANTATFVVEGRYDAPNVVPDTAGSTEDVVLNIPALEGLLSNDIGSDLSVIAFDDFSANDAKVNVNPDGSYSYDPRLPEIIQALEEGETFQDTFKYTIEDTVEEITSEGEVTINLTGINDDPVAKNDQINPASEDNILNVKVLSNDTDPEDNPLTVSTIKTTSDSKATLTVKPDGSIDYNPTSSKTIQALGTGQTLTDKFIYAIDDGKGGIDQARVTVKITGVNDAPEATDDVSSGTENGVLNLSVAGLLSNDTDPEKNPLILASFDGASTNGAKVTLNLDGSLNYDPTEAETIQALGAGETLADTFTYTIDDGQGGEDTATVTINLTGVNDAPEAEADTEATDEDTALNIAVLANDLDPDGEDLAVSIVETTSVSGAALTVNSDGSIDYDPSASATIQALGAEETLVDTFAYTIDDGRGGTDTATVTINLTGINDAPKASAINQGIINEDSVNPFTVNLLDTATDPELDALTVGNIEIASSNQARVFDYTINEVAKLSLEPNLFNDLAVGTSETVTISYDIADGDKTTSNTATFVVQGRNDAPKVVTEIPNQFTSNTDTFSLDVSQNFSDVDANDQLSFTTTGFPKGLSISANGLISGTAPGIYPVTITAKDLAKASVSDTFNLVVQSLMVGTPNNDVLNGNDKPNQIDGLAGDDDISGFGSDDLLIGGEGNDYLKGYWGNDRLEGDAGNDSISGGIGIDSLYGSLGDDVIYGASEADLLHGGMGQDNLFGSSGSDLLMGNIDNDTLYGGTENDTLYGGTENDLLQGDAGLDQLYGDEGADTFVLQSGLGLDTIYDYEVNVDSLKLASGFQGNLGISQSDGNTTISILNPGGETAIATLMDVSNVTLGDLGLVR